MNKKYEFVKATSNHPSGVTLKRIRALITIADTVFMPAVNPGDLGGYISPKTTLSEMQRNALVWDCLARCRNARVYGNAGVWQRFGVSTPRASGNASGVQRNARVADDAWVYGDTQVYGDAQVSGNASGG